MSEPDTMRALVAQGVGEPVDVLRLESRPRPEPGDGQVLVRVHAAPIHASDLHTVRGRYGYTPEFPTVLGSESVGVIAAVGPGVEAVEVGQRVITVLVTGTWQEFIVVAASQVVPVPDGLDDSTACQLTTNPLDRGATRRARSGSSPASGSCRRRRARRWASSWSSWRAIAASRRSTSSGAGPL